MSVVVLHLDAYRFTDHIPERDTKRRADWVGSDVNFMCKTITRGPCVHGTCCCKTFRCPGHAGHELGWLRMVILYSRFNDAWSSQTKCPCPQMVRRQAHRQGLSRSEMYVGLYESKTQCQACDVEVHSTLSIILRWPACLDLHRSIKLIDGLRGRRVFDSWQ